MPIYEFDCECGNSQDELFKMADCPKDIVCSKCGGKAVKVISRFKIQCDGINDVSWLPSALENLPDSDRPIESRGDYKRFLKEKGLTATG